MRSPSPAEWRSARGSVTAEFATIMPAVILVLAFCLSGVQLAGQQLRLQDAASGAARSAARGEPFAAVSARIAALVPRASAHTSNRGDLVCVTVSVPATLAAGLASMAALSASGCALGGGQ